jgi:hypothetical protein
MMSKPREESLTYQDHREETEDLDQQYHKIGIPAVVAALRYWGDGPVAEKADHSAETQNRAS